MRLFLLGISQCYISGANREVYYTSGQRKELNNCALNKFVWRPSDMASISFPRFSNWKTGEPNCYAGLKENCVQYRCEDREDNCYWNDYYCGYNACALCQIDL